MAILEVLVHTFLRESVRKSYLTRRMGSDPAYLSEWIDGCTPA